MDDKSRRGGQDDYLKNMTVDTGCLMSNNVNDPLNRRDKIVVLSVSLGRLKDLSIGR